MPIGFDCGTYNLVSCRRDANGNCNHKREVNAFIEIPLVNRFVFNMMKQAGVPLVERGNVAYALGEASVNMAYTMNQIELKRPMSAGCVNPKERDAFEIMKIMMHSLIGEIDVNKEILYYSVPANAVNEETDADYHNKILKAIFDAYKTKDGKKVDARPINEALALIYAELQSTGFTGVGVSCLIPGTKIYTNKGIVPIETVKPGDMVLTHKGRWRPINKVIVSQFAGKSIHLQLTGYSNNTEEYGFVQNHELYVLRDNEWQWIGCDEIKEGDIVGEPILDRDYSASALKMNICERVTSSNKYTKKGIEVTPDVQRLMGYFLGDGSINEEEGCIQFDFGAHENQYVEDVQEILTKNFDKNSSVVKKGENCNRVKCYSKGLVNWFGNHCYDENGDKKYPWDLSRVTRNECLNLLIGLIRSDGTNEDDLITFSNTSTSLAMTAKQAFSRIGLPASIYWREPRSHFCEEENREIVGKKNEWVVSTGAKNAYFSLSQLIEEVNCDNARQCERIFIHKGFCCGRVQKVEIGHYDGEVYDLQVEEDHSFSGPFLTIHNCGAGMVNVCLAIFGAPVFEFAIVNSGDWIDKMAAKATGESIAFINLEKTKVDLSKEPANLIERAIQTQYRIMIEKTVQGIKKGIDEAGNKARTANGLDVVIAGGTSSPNGFPELFQAVLEQANLPIKINKVTRPVDPLYSVARGCLIAAENHSE